MKGLAITIILVTDVLAKQNIDTTIDEYSYDPANTDAIKELQKINWTGNIREFRNVLERLIILCEKEITGKDVTSYAMPISK